MSFSRLLYLLPSCAVCSSVLVISQSVSAERSLQTLSLALSQEQNLLEQGHTLIALDATQTCLEALNAAHNRLSNVEGELRINTVDKEDISQEYPDHPTGRPYEYYFLMDGPAVETVFSSPLFIENIASSIFQSCDDAGKVSFWQDHSGWNYTLGWTSEEMIEFECLDPGAGGPPPRWGEQYCT